MTKKFITLIMAVLLPLSAFLMSADEKEAMVEMTVTNLTSFGDLYEGTFTIE